MTSVFNPKNCTIPDVPPIENMPVLVDCDIPVSPDPITDCPDIDLPIPAILGWMGFECIGGGFGPPGPGGPPGPAGPPGPPGSICIRVHSMHICVKVVAQVRVQVFTWMQGGCYHIQFIFYVYCPHDKELCCWWKYCPSYAAPGDPADALFECKHGEDGYTSPYVGNGGASGDDCPWVLITKNAACEDCDNGPCSEELMGAYTGQVEIWCDCNEVEIPDCTKCGACWLPHEILATVDIRYEQEVYLDDGGTCWTPVDSGQLLCQTITLTREKTEEEPGQLAENADFECWTGTMSLDKLAHSPAYGGTTVDEADAGGKVCELADLSSDGALCPVIKWCCNANGVGEEEPKMSIMLEDRIIPLTGLATDDWSTCGEVLHCGLVGEDLDDNDIPPKLGTNGWIRKCLLDCNADEIEPDPLDEDDGCVDWCHGFDKEVVGGGHPIILDAPVCEDESVTKRIRIHQLAVKIQCQCCDPDNEAV